MKKKAAVIISVLLAIVIVAGVLVTNLMNRGGFDMSDPTAQAPQGEVDLHINNSKWNYDKNNNVYWQSGLWYCKKPQAYDYETLSIYVPGDYFNGIENGDGTYTCEINNENTVSGYTADTAPIVFPVNTPGYSAMMAKTEYESRQSKDYTDAGFIYVYAGMRGRQNGENADGSTYEGGAPWGVTDLKAAVKYYRYNSDALPGDTDAIFTFGHSGGGAQSSIMGATGDDESYLPYLNAIGAVNEDDNGNKISDAIAGAMCWCPITAFDAADEAYEWNMGQYYDKNTRADGKWTSALSFDLAEGFGEYINSLNLSDLNGNALTLEKTENGIYTSGTYYEFVKSEIEVSLNNYISDNNLNAGDYVNSLNEKERWVKLNSSTGKAEITSIEAFVKYNKDANKDVCAFDDLNRGQAENFVFGTKDYNALHFNERVYNIIVKNKDVYSSMSGWDESIITEYETDLACLNTLGDTISHRADMYNPMYYVNKAYNGYGTSTPAKYWRINSGITQGDTALTTELNLALSLEQCEDVESVDFNMVWEQGHTEAERTGNSSENFIAWVNTCLSK